jgi:aminoglycoside phosphotransferase family enzyme/predicted kinase
MITEDQSAVIDLLSAPSTHGGAPVERIETHASIVFLAGPRAWKLKRAVKYDYLDFSTVERRKAMCQAEVRVNRRTAPFLYRGVTPVVRGGDGSLTLGGPGLAIDWVVEMNRFDQEHLLDRLAARDALDLALMPPLATAIAHFHLAAERRIDYGGARGMAWVIEGNAAGFAEEGRGVLDPGLAHKLTADARTALDRRRALLDRRQGAGFVRRCHGDLHLRNIVLVDGNPTLFDGIEFNDEISCIDVLYDLAFLLMDLWRRGLPLHANAVLNGYLAETQDFEALPLLPLFLSCRSAVRAKTSATAARLQHDPRRRAELEDLARSYLALAARLLHPPPGCVIAIGGFSGTGKSTLARALAPSIGGVPGAVVVRSDEVRKRLCGVDPLTRLGPAGYGAEVTRRVYETLNDRAAAVARSGHAVVVDAVFARDADRIAIQRAAEAAAVPFLGLWLDAPEPVLVDRIRRRRADASDAGAAVVRAQLAHGAGSLAWTRITASGDASDVALAAGRTIDTALKDAAAPCAPASA